MHGPRPDDQAGRAGAGAPPVERGVRGGDDLRVLGETEVVVRRERDDGAPVGRELAFGPGGVEVDAARATGPASRIAPGLRASAHSAQLIAASLARS